MKTSLIDIAIGSRPISCREYNPDVMQQESRSGRASLPAAPFTDAPEFVPMMNTTRDGNAARMNAIKQVVVTALLLIGLALAPFAAEAKPADRVDVIVVYKAKPDAAEKNRIKALGGKARREFRNLNMRVISIPERALANVGKGKNVKFVARDREVFSLAAPSHATARIPAPGSANAMFSGHGVGVAVIDSGIGQHTDLGNVTRVHLVRPYTRLTHGVRHDADAQALYVFDEGLGATLFDRADDGTVTDMLDLDVESASGLSWGSNAMTFGSPSRASSAAGATKVFDACTASNAISVEAWVRPANTTQDGPARIVTFSLDSGRRNFTLAQDGSRYEFRLRTTSNGDNGLNTRLWSAWGSVQTSLQHIVATRDAQGNAFLYLNGVLVDKDYIGGDFSNWNSSYGFGLGNEFSTSPTNTNRDWTGDYHLAAVHCRALSAAEVSDHFAAGSDALRTDHDPLGHGTHVAGIVAGNGNASGNAYRGAAGGASLVSLRTLDEAGRGVASDTIAALDWLLSHGADYNIKVVNLSLGKAVEESSATDPLVLAVEQVWDAGMVVVVAAGNHGRDGNMTITSPANSRKVITVGSLTDNGTGDNFADDFVSTFSSMGPTLGDHILKPDLVAPGNRVVATISEHAKFKTDLPDRVVPCAAAACTSDYLELSGTSMAAPLVAAVAAAMLEKDPGLSPATVKARLMRSARKIDADPTASGAGVLDVDAALTETGFVTGEALSPLMKRADDEQAVYLEDTAELWGDGTWDASYLWTKGYLWTRSTVEADSYLWSEAYLWTNSYLWTKAEQWNDGYLWSDAYLWSRAYLWTNAVTDYHSLYQTSGQSMSLNDD